MPASETIALSFVGAGLQFTFVAAAGAGVGAKQAKENKTPHSSGPIKRLVILLLLRQPRSLRSLFPNKGEINKLLDAADRRQRSEVWILVPLPLAVLFPRVSSSGLASPKFSVTNAEINGSYALPLPDDAPFDTVVVLMMENRSFDHMLGWLPGANGRQKGLSYADENGVLHDTWPLAPDYQGCQ